MAKYGKHNMRNALMAIAAARHIGVMIPHAIEALSHFKLPKRRLEQVGEIADIVIYDDFAHHPTSIRDTIGITSPCRCTADHCCF